jgi:5'-nucleotidase (lipoprotein e(P4) family)
MKTLFVKYLPLAWCMLLACSTPEQKVQSPVNEDNQDHLIMSTLYMQQSAEYKAQCLQTYQAATYQLAQMLRNKPQRPAVVLDLDETVLDNSPYTAWQIKNGQSYDKAGWKRWSELAAAEAIPGAVSFLQKADSMGVHLWFISNRMTDELDATIKNMKSLGIPQTSPEHFVLKTTTSVKTARRDSVRALGFNIVMLIGDNLADFEGVWDEGSNEDRANAVYERAALLGVKYFLLPNPIYGTWEGAMYNYNKSLSPMQKDSIRRSLLREPKNM